MSCRNCFLIFLLILSFASLKARHTNYLIIELSAEEFLQISSAYVDDNNRPFPLLKKLQVKKDLGRKYTAAILAFPFPFGIVGLHRIYLGCAPYIPVVYIATLGGVFGLLPLIDCIAIMASKDAEKFVNNNQVFMWVGETQ